MHPVISLRFLLSLLMGKLCFMFEKGWLKTTILPTMFGNYIRRFEEFLTSNIFHIKNMINIKADQLPLSNKIFILCPIDMTSGNVVIVCNISYIPAHSGYGIWYFIIVTKFILVQDLNYISGLTIVVSS